MFDKLLAISLAIMTLGSCTNDRSTADLIIHNAVIYTADTGFTIYTSMAVADGKVLALGDDRYIAENYTSDSIFDANGKPIYPGFIDAHCHFYGYSLLGQYANLSTVRTFDQLLDTLAAHHERQPSEWLTGRGWDQNRWPGKQFPDNTELNTLYPETPVVLIRVDGHAVLVNQAAILRAGITPDSVSNKSEALMKDGKFTGVFLESFADRFRNLIPSPMNDELSDLLSNAANSCFEVGLTMVADAGLEAQTIDFIDEMQSDGDLKMAVYAMLTPNDENIERFLKRGIRVRPKLMVRSVKLYADGALGSRGACLLQPYSDMPGEYGIATITPDELGRICLLAYDNGYQVCTHAIGDSATRTVLNVYSNYLLPSNDFRWRIEHAQIVHPDDFSKFGEFAIIPSVQATHATSDMGWAGERLGKERLRNAYAYRKLMAQNGWLPNGTDFPIENISPVLTFYAAVARKDLNGQPQTGFQKENALTREEALKSITTWAAKSCFEENRRGSLAPGMNADFVILDTDIMVVPEKEIFQAKALRTYIDGEVVFMRNNNL
jgi:predicted amidohydrolase YtcJ